MKRLVLSAILSVLAAAAFAQGTNIALGGIDADPDAPVEISAENLAVDQESGAAVFSGNVVIGQGELRISAGQVEVVYGETGSDIDRLTATGGVTFVTPETAAEAQRADYNLADQQLVLTGEVLLTQGQSAISAERMTVDLESGNAVMEGRVRTVLQQGQ
ncbi:lipopolysaccharide transport periplasmic protein LptA [Aestuariibius insulae]|uniref:lipopolysaccharide transport periplasmic protein LptA n=1 Tax=Aestuariibius insulae TaxID=2058287 RepID=UPI00345EC180